MGLTLKEERWLRLTWALWFEKFWAIHGVGKKSQMIRYIEEARVRLPDIIVVN